MPKWLKVVLILLGVVVLLCGLSSAGAYWWVSQNKDRLKGVGEKAKKEGAAFAYEHDAPECVDEGLRRLTERSGIVDQAEHKLFLNACLEKASRPEAFCSGVPRLGDLFASATWAMEQCVAKARPQDQDCARLMSAIQNACEHPAPIPAG
jgi:hypothetical protein